MTTDLTVATGTYPIGYDAASNLPFDGSVVLHAAATFDHPSGTLDFHVKVTDAGGGTPIIGEHTDSGKGRVAVLNADGTLTISGVITPSVGDGAWHHVALVVNHDGDANGAQVYLDGAFVANSDYGAARFGFNGGLDIGNAIGSLPGTFVLHFGDIRVSRGPRWTAPFTPPSEPTFDLDGFFDPLLEAYWPLQVDLGDRGFYDGLPLSQVGVYEHTVAPDEVYVVEVAGANTALLGLPIRVVNHGTGPAFARAGYDVEVDDPRATVVLPGAEAVILPHPENPAVAVISHEGATVSVIRG